MRPGQPSQVHNIALNGYHKQIGSNLQGRRDRETLVGGGRERGLHLSGELSNSLDDIELTHRDDVRLESVCVVGALEDGGELRVPHARLLPRRAHRPGADPNLKVKAKVY